MKKKIFFVFLLATLFAFGAMSIASASTFIWGVSTDAERLDPGDTSIGTHVDPIFEGLVKLKEGLAEIEPSLATSWDVSEDGTEVIFHLRKGVKFHDGTDFNADAVVFSYARMYDRDHPYNQYGEWSNFKNFFSDIDRVEKIDDYTVKLVFKRPNAAIFTLLGYWILDIVSPTNAEKHKEEAFKNPVGTGPFKFVEWVKDDYIVYEANENYWQERAKLDKLIIKVIPTPTARLMALEVGEIHGMEDPNPADFDRIKANKDLKLLTQPGLNIGYMAMNTGYGYIDANENGVRDKDSEPLVKTKGYFEPFTKKKVRQAIQMGIDKQSLVDNVYMGTASKAKTAIPPSVLGYNDDIEDYPYDPERARALLAEAGYPDGFEVTLHAMPNSRPYMFDPPKVGTAIQSYLADIGVKVNIYQIDWTTYLQQSENGEAQMILLGWYSNSGDPADWMNVLYVANNAAIGTSDNMAWYDGGEELQEILANALLTFDPEERAEYYKKAQEIIVEDAGWVFLNNSNQNVVLRQNAYGYVLHPTTRDFFYPVWVEE